MDTHQLSRTRGALLTLPSIAVVTLTLIGCGGGNSSAKGNSISSASTAPVEAAPVLTPIQAVFNQPAFSTSYTEQAAGEAGATYNWTVSIPNDPRCATGFTPGTPQPNKATWYHADVPDGGPCSHTAEDYGPSGHHSTVTVEVTTSHWHCAATYNGTTTGAGAQPGACTRL